MKRILLLGLIMLLTLSGCAVTKEERTVSEPCLPAPVYDWGITLKAAEATPTGITVHCTHTGELCRPVTGSGFLAVERWDSTEWTEPECLSEKPEEFTLQTHAVTGGTVEWRYNWSQIYGALPEGTYRLAKTFFVQEDDDRNAPDAQQQICYVMFTVGQPYEQDYYTVRLLPGSLAEVPESKVTVYDDLLLRMETSAGRQVAACELPRYFSPQSVLEYALADYVLFPDGSVREPLLLRVEAADAVFYLEESGRLVAETEEGTYAAILSEDSLGWLLEQLVHQWNYRLPEAGSGTVPPGSYNRHLTYLPADDAVWSWLQEQSETAGGSYPVLSMDSAEELEAMKAKFRLLQGADTAYGVSPSVLETLGEYASLEDWFAVYRTYMICIRDDLTAQHMVSMEEQDGTIRFLVHRYAPMEPVGEDGIWICFYSVLREDCGETVCSGEGEPIMVWKSHFTESDAEAAQLLETKEYCVWSVGFSELRVSVDGTAMLLDRALQDGRLTVKQLLLCARMDALNGICRVEHWNDGGSISYVYPSYTVTRLHTPEIMEGDTVLEWNCDIWITPVGAQLPPVQERILAE